MLRTLSYNNLSWFTKEENEEGEDAYSWHGIDLAKLYPIFLDILNGGKKETENNIWLVFRDFVQIMLKNRKVIFLNI